MQRLRVRFQSRRWTELITKRCSVFMCLSLLVALSNPTNTGGRRWPSSCFESNRRHCHRSLYVDVHSYKLQKPSESSVHHDKWTDSYIVLYTHSPYFKRFLSKCIRGEKSGFSIPPKDVWLADWGSQGSNHRGGSTSWPTATRKWRKSGKLFSTTNILSMDQNKLRCTTQISLTVQGNEPAGGHGNQCVQKRRASSFSLVSLGLLDDCVIIIDTLFMERFTDSLM